MSLAGKKVAILVADMYQELEFWYPYLRLKEEGAEVLAVGPEAKEYKSKLGYPAKADLGAKDVRPPISRAWSSLAATPRITCAEARNLCGLSRIWQKRGSRWPLFATAHGCYVRPVW